jgi:hypothetical protein
MTTRIDKRLHPNTADINPRIHGSRSDIPPVVANEENGGEAFEVTTDPTPERGKDIPPAT